MSAADNEESHGESFYRQLCEHVGVALIATDEDLNIRSWNAAASRMFGTEAETMIGTPVSSIIPMDRREAAGRRLRRTINTGETNELEFRYRDATGRRREFSGTIAPLVDESGTRIGASICIRDITRRIELQTELLESRKMASLGEMAGAIAHHFNNILGGVVTSIDYAMTAADPSVVSRVLNQASRSLMRASTLVNGLLAFSEGGPRPDDLADLTELLNELADDMEVAIDGRNIRFELKVSQLPVVPVPRTQLATILRNIMQNAIEAMPKGGVLSVEAVMADDSVNVIISDTGRGLDEATRSRIFEPFWTTKGDPVDRGGSIAGLGLAIAHGLVHIIGGSISVESEPDKGSKFTVSIPIPECPKETLSS